jgi:thioredoxin-like negative regulator of GroEL
MTNFARHYFRLSPARLRTCVIGLAIACAAFGGDNTTKNLSRAERALKSGDFQRAEQIYRELLTKNDQNLEARLGLSHTLLKQRRLQDAFDHAARVIAIDPLSARGHALLGAAVLASGDFRLSVE